MINQSIETELHYHEWLSTYLDNLYWQKSFDNDFLFHDKIYQVVNNRLEKPLPIHIWEAIDKHFEYYWDEVVGVGGYVCNEQLEDHIYNGLIYDKIPYPKVLVKRIVGIVMNYLEMTMVLVP